MKEKALKEKHPLMACLSVKPADRLKNHCSTWGETWHDPFMIFEDVKDHYIK